MRTLQASQTLGFNLYEGEDWRFTGGLRMRLYDKAGTLIPTVRSRAFPENIDTLVSAEFGAAQGASAGAHRDA